MITPQNILNYWLHQIDKKSKSCCRETEPEVLLSEILSSYRRIGIFKKLENVARLRITYWVMELNKSLDEILKGLDWIFFNIFKKKLYSGWNFTISNISLFKRITWLDLSKVFVKSLKVLIYLISRRNLYF